MTPGAEETLVRLASWMPYAQAQELLQDLVGIQVSKATARRATLQTGKAALTLDEAEVERLKQEVPQAPAGADKQQLSADGAMVHLVGGEWVEVKTLVMGEVTRNKRGEVCTQQLSTFSRLCDAERFTQASLVETHRRGLEQAAAVCAVQDGAEWLQGLVDYHRADAVRILDFAHAAEYVNEIGQAVQAAGGRLPTTWLEGVLHRLKHRVLVLGRDVANVKWLEGVLHRLKHQGPERVLKHLAWLAARYPSPLIQEKLAYLHKREAHMQYPTYQQAGWPIGSGSVESANKVVVEARLKGAGMRWERHNVNPMLVLRNAVCNRRWNMKCEILLGLLEQGAAQCGLQSALEPDVAGRQQAAAAEPPTASRQAHLGQEATLLLPLLRSRATNSFAPSASKRVMNAIMISKSAKLRIGFAPSASKRVMNRP